jgi:Flp pilus assembly protein TadG
MRFWRDRRGNVAIMFALAVVPVVGAMGAALDYTLASSYRTDMQQALDAAALAVSKVMPMEQAALDKVATQYFTASLGNHSLTNIKVSVVPGQGHAKLHASGDYTPSMVGLLGIDKFEVGVHAEARWGMGKVEVALVLDNSGSMGQHNRITHLKAAAHDLLQVLEDAAKNPGDAKVGIVPFDSAVRLPYNQNNAPNWIKWGHNGSCNISGGRNQDTSTQIGCIDAGGVWTWKVWQTNNQKWSSWSGCVEDRDKDPNLDHDVLDTVPNNSNSNSNSARQTRFPARPCDDDSLNTVMPLNTTWGTKTSTDAATLHGKINSMQPAGFTNIAIGLAWGWHVLSPTAPYTEGAAYGTKDLTKYIVLMTDGDNTRSRYYSCSGSGGCAIDNRTEAVCTNIKKTGIQIFSIRLVDGNTTLLRNCASSPSMYFDVQDASALSSVFKLIGTQIARLHLSK